MSDEQMTVTGTVTDEVESGWVITPDDKNLKPVLVTPEQLEVEGDDTLTLGMEVEFDYPAPDERRDLKMVSVRR